MSNANAWRNLFRTIGAFNATALRELACGSIGESKTEGLYRNIASLNKGGDTHERCEGVPVGFKNLLP